MDWPRDFRAEGVKQRGFANAGLAGDENGGALGLADALQVLAERIELGFAADQRGVARVAAVYHFRDSVEKAVAAFGDSLDVLRAGGVVAEQLAQFEDVGAQHLGLHVGVRPEGFEQLVVRDEPLRIFDKIAQHRKWTRGEGEHFLALPQAFILRIDAIVTELLHCWKGLLFHSIG
jgi:hypothetical protein